MSPSVQVALISIIGILITTLGAVLVAFIQAKKPTSPPEDEPWDERDILQRMWELITETHTQEKTIEELRGNVSALSVENTRLKEEIVLLHRKLREKIEGDESGG